MTASTETVVRSGSRARLLLRSRLARISVVAVALTGTGGSVAAALPPGGAVDNPQGAVASVAPNPANLGTVITFSGTGFSAGEQVSVKIDDGKILKKGSTSDVLTVVEADAAGAVTGTLDLSQVNASTPVVAGAHNVRFLSGFPRSLHADFAVVDPAAAPTPTPAPGQPTPTPGAGVQPTPVPAAPAATPVAKTGGTVVESPITLASTTLTVSKAKVSIGLRAGAAGSAGTVKLRTAARVKVGGKGKAKLVTLSKTDSYYLGKVGRATVKLALSADGKRVLKKGKTTKAVLIFKDAAGISITQNVTVKG
ncbi:MAG: hypothetical protein AAGC46_04690 [Solirubrobacteraceae bacterium]|nr:hypothetical protein [Patulibacter sp.]